MPPGKNDGTNISEALEIERRGLLDLGLRNPLLNYRPLGTKGVEVIGGEPVEVFQLLVREEKSLTFLSAEAGGRFVSAVAGADQSAQPGGDRNGPGRHRDLRLQTAYAPAQLRTRLHATYRAARTSMEEQGVNTLYLALGMLSWSEEEHSEHFCRAPLILIPVELERSDARDWFRLKYTGDELGENVSLAEKLKQSFAIRKFPGLPEPEDLDVRAHFKDVQRAVSGQTGWAVDTDVIALGFFSFAKFLMYRDLDPATWPAADAILGNGVLQSLLAEQGFPPSASPYREDCLLDGQVQHRDIVHVVDSDSSQTIAILDALDGHSMVIQGPPGTGKSQTIVNLIAGAVALGKRVLFVSEKMAALDVVKRRLDLVRLGVACLELHSNRTNKKTIIAELHRTALGDRQAIPQARGELSLLADARDRLNAYCEAVNKPIGASGESPCTAYGKLLGSQTSLKGLDLPALSLEGAVDWTAEEATRRGQLVAQLQDRVTRSGVPVRHPFWGSQLKILLPTDRDEIRKLAIDAAAACAGLEQAAGALALTFSAESPQTDRAVETLCQSARHVLAAPDLGGVALGSPEWVSDEQSIRQALAVGARDRDIHRQYGAALRPEAWGADTSELRQAVAELGGRWWRVLSSRWRHAKKSLGALCTSAQPPGRTAQLALLDAIAESARCAQTIAGAGDSMARLFTASWKGADSDWDLLAVRAEWAIAAHKGIQLGELAAWCLEPDRIAVERADASARIGELGPTHQAYRLAVQRWADRLRIDESKIPDGRLANQAFSTLVSRWTLRNNGIDELHSLLAFNQTSAECEKEVQGVAAVAAAWELAGTLLIPLYERARAAALLDRAFRERPALATFDGVRHGSTVAEFRRLDLLQLEYNRSLLAAKHAQSVPSGGGAGEIGILWREFQKSNRFLPIRSLMGKAGQAIQSIKPVFMMSPLSIANYLPPGAIRFDLIVFDEASQVRPVEALGAIARGQQVVVVGDSKQLPPTNFFGSAAADDAEPEDESTPASDIESVLGLFCSRGAHQRMLRWHYRSRHESLISVSNHLSYRDRLVVFPSPDRDRKKLGLVYRRLDNSPYDCGGTRTSPVEAEAVAAAVMAHARTQLPLPMERRETLGVAAFSIAQMDAVWNQVELLRQQDPSCEEFFAYPPQEPFFVKNLENVQGDERDVIFISIGYGRTKEGKPATSFGPLNRAGGERRLNVLISRARRRCEVFTSLCAEDIDLSKTSSTGVADLKTFLHYAETGQMDVPAQSERAPDSEFEEEVLRQLTGLGHVVHRQVGSAGFSLDLAVVDSLQPGRYVLGIECDGAGYHCAQSARDRDRLRQSVLQGLGWRIHRIWSTEWFHNPDGELRKVVQAIETARAVGPPAARPVPIVEALAPPVTAQPPAVPPQRLAAAPYECARVSVRLGDVDMHMVSRTQLADLLAQVVRLESPVHWTEAAHRVLSGAGVQRFGTRIQQAFNEAVRLGVSRKDFLKRGEFLWEPSMQQPPVRDRSALPAASRKLELVAPEELQRAILIVVQESYGIVPGEVPNAVCRLIGFSRVTDDMSAAVGPHRDQLLREGRLALQGDNLVLATSQ